MDNALRTLLAGFALVVSTEIVLESSHRTPKPPAPIHARPAARRLPAPLPEPEPDWQRRRKGYYPLRPCECQANPVEE